MSKIPGSRRIIVLNVFCSFSLRASLIYALLVGLSYVIAGVAVTALAAVAMPLAMASDGILEGLLGIVQALVEGFVVVIEAVFSIISSLFNG